MVLQIFPREGRLKPGLGQEFFPNKPILDIRNGDPLQAQPHDVDVKALLRISVVYNIPLACNRSSADFLISSKLMDKPYERFLIDYGKRMQEVTKE